MCVNHMGEEDLLEEEKSLITLWEGEEDSLEEEKSYQADREDRRRRRRTAGGRRSLGHQDPR